MSGWRNRLWIYGVGGLIGVVVLAVGVVLLTDWSFVYGRSLESALSRRLDRTVTVAGPVQIRFGLHGPTLVMRNVTLANAPWGEAPDMAHAGRINIRARWLPLFAKRIVVDTIVLEDVSARLETGADGRTNRPRPKEPSSAFATVHGMSVSIPTSFTLRHLALDYAGAPGASALHVDVDHARVTERAQGVALQAQGMLRGSSFAVDALIVEPKALLRGRQAPVQMALTIGETRIFTKGRLGNPSRPGGIHMQIDGRGPNLRDVGKLVGVDDLPEEGKFNFSAMLDFAEGQLALQDVSIGLGTGTIVGTVDAHGKPNSKGVVIDVLLASESLDLELLQGNWSKLIDVPKLWSLPIPVEVWRTSDVNLTYQAQSLTYRALELGGVNANATLSDGVLTVFPLAFSVGDAFVNAQMTLDLTQDAPEAQIKLETRHFPLGNALASTETLRGLEGPLDLSVDVHGRGDSLRAIASTLDGTINGRMGPGHIDAELLQSLPQPLRGTWATWAKGAAMPGTTGVPLECATLDLTFKNGQSDPAKFTLISGQVQAATSGRLVLGAPTTDILLTAEPRPQSLLKKLQGTGYSVRLTGKAFAPDLALAPFTSMAVGAPGQCVLTARSKIPEVDESGPNL